MEPRETSRRYDAIASMWDASRSESTQGIDFLERAVGLCRLRRTALDVGCGSGGPMLATLLHAGFRITGLDVSAKMLEIARTRHPSVDFVHDDIAQWTPPRTYDLVVAWDSIFHLPHGAHAPVVEKLCACVAGQGVLLFTAGGIDGEVKGTMHGQEFAYSSLSGIALVELVERGGCIPVVIERDQYPLHHLVIMAAKA